MATGNWHFSASVLQCFVKCWPIYFCYVSVALVHFTKQNDLRTEVVLSCQLWLKWLVFPHICLKTVSSSTYSGLSTNISVDIQCNNEKMFEVRFLGVILNYALSKEIKSNSIQRYWRSLSIVRDSCVYIGCSALYRTVSTLQKYLIGCKSFGISRKRHGWDYSSASNFIIL